MIPLVPVPADPPDRRRHNAALIAAGRCLLALACLLGGTSLSAQEPASGAPLFAPTARPEQDDATLHAVAFAAGRIGLAVGDHGSIWRTTDGGRHWEFRDAGVDAALTAVTLLDERHGWAVGQSILPDTRVALGVVVHTDDGGRTWRRIDDGLLPPLSGVQFFSPQRGAAVGRGDVRRASGVFLTEDGGRTWEAAPGPYVDGWSSAAFLDARNGVLVGRQGLVGTLGNGRVLPIRSQRSLRSIQAVTLQADGRGWLVGDGGLLRMTDDAGATWPEAFNPLPEAIREQQDLRAVAAVGERVWAAGNPGGVVWHSPDAGRTWRPQPTQDAAPIEALAFFTPQDGCAVGCFGQIRMTHNGGLTWHTVRGGGRRPAVLAIHAAASQVALPLVTRESGENGYRSIVATLTRRDVGADERAHRDAADGLRAQVLAAGGNDVDANWRLPLRTPDLNRLSERLVEDWSRLHEERLRDVMLGGLVAALRTWRPEVLVLDEPRPDDAATSILHDALTLALEQAADETRYPEHRQLGLSAWSVSKVFVRAPAVEERTPSGVVIEPFQFLPRTGTTLAQAASRAAACGPAGSNSRPVRESFRLIRVRRELEPASGGELSTSPLGRSVFAGLTLPPGGDVRREQPPLRDVQEEQLLALARHQRNFAAYSERLLDDPVRAGQLIAQLRDTLQPLPRDEAARLLANLADDYGRRAQWDLAEDALTELVERYPEQPPARAAARRLLARWTSQELLWQHLRTLSATSPTESLDTAVLQANFEQALQAVLQAENSVQAEMQVNALPSPLQRREQSGILRVGGLSAVVPPGRAAPGAAPVGGVNQMQVEIARRWSQARRVVDLLQQTDPALLAQPEVQFILAALHREQQRPEAAAEIYRSHFGLDDGSDPWHMTARGELWSASRGALSPKPVVRCARAAKPPVLDGLLHDPCWNAASEVRLQPPTELTLGNDPTFAGARRIDGLVEQQRPLARSGEPAAIVMLAYDDHYLYLAASVPRHAGVPVVPVQTAGRTHDADLATHDRLRFAFDVDRDYATWYQFEVDQRGAVRESLGDDVAWNPKWYVAADADPDHWRIEAAVPWERLVPAPPRRGAIWAAGLTRMIPAVGVQTWTAADGETVRPETFGLLQFD